MIRLAVLMLAVLPVASSASPQFRHSETGFPACISIPTNDAQSWLRPFPCNRPTDIGWIDSSGYPHITGGRFSVDFAISKMLREAYGVPVKLEWLPLDDDDQPDMIREWGDRPER